MSEIGSHLVNAFGGLAVGLSVVALWAWPVGGLLVFVASASTGINRCAFYRRGRCVRGAVLLKRRISGEESTEASSKTSSTFWKPAMATRGRLSGMKRSADLDISCRPLKRQRLAGAIFFFFLGLRYFFVCFVCSLEELISVAMF